MFVKKKKNSVINTIINEYFIEYWILQTRLAFYNIYALTNNLYIDTNFYNVKIVKIKDLKYFGNNLLNEICMNFSSDY